VAAHAQFQYNKMGETWRLISKKTTIRCHFVKKDWLTCSSRDTRWSIKKQFCSKPQRMLNSKFHQHPN